MTWQIAVEHSSTHCHQVLPATRAVGSAEPTTALWRTAAAIGSAARTNGAFARQDVDQRAFTDGDAEYLVEKPCQPLKADRLGGVQVDDQRAQPGAERRARLEPRRHRGTHPLTAAGAAAVMAVDTRDDRADRRQVDVVIGV